MTKLYAAISLRLSERQFAGARDLLELGYTHKQVYLTGLDAIFRQIEAEKNNEISVDKPQASPVE